MEKLFNLIKQLELALKEDRVKDAILIEKELHYVMMTFEDAC